MAFINITADLKYVGKQLRRIADALEVLVPPPQEATEITPDEAVTYVDEEAMAERELREEVDAVAKAYREQREREEAEEADGGLGVFNDREGT